VRARARVILLMASSVWLVSNGAFGAWRFIGASVGLSSSEEEDGELECECECGSERNEKCSI
jgi:hypothetical protein